MGTDVNTIEGLRIAGARGCGARVLGLGFREKEILQPS